MVSQAFTYLLLLYIFGKGFSVPKPVAVPKYSNHIQKYRQGWQDGSYYSNLGKTVKEAKLNTDIYFLNFCKEQRIVPGGITSHNPLITTCNFKQMI